LYLIGNLHTEWLRSACVAVAKRFAIRSSNRAIGRAVRRQAAAKCCSNAADAVGPPMVVSQIEGLEIGSYFWAAFLAARMIQALNLRLTSAPPQHSRSFHARRLLVGSHDAIPTSCRSICLPSLIYAHRSPPALRVAPLTSRCPGFADCANRQFAFHTVLLPGPCAPTLPSMMSTGDGTICREPMAIRRLVRARAAA
jgi:hypothetical protein